MSSFSKKLRVIIFRSLFPSRSSEGDEVITPALLSSRDESCITTRQKSIGQSLAFSAPCYMQIMHPALLLPVHYADSNPSYMLELFYIAYRLRHAIFCGIMTKIKGDKLKTSFWKMERRLARETSPETW